MPSTIFYNIACFSGASGVVAGAFGAHALKARLTPHQQANWQTAAHYQLIHTVALLFVSTLPAPMVPGALFTAGITMFSGSLYGLCFLKEGHPARKFLGPITPLGGLCLIGGWVALAMTRGKFKRL